MLKPPLPRHPLLLPGFFVQLLFHLKASKEETSGTYTAIIKAEQDGECVYEAMSTRKGNRAVYQWPGIIHTLTVIYQSMHYVI